MAKDKTIDIKFDLDVTGTENNSAAFKLTGKKYRYVGGPLDEASYTVVATGRPDYPRASVDVTGGAFASGVHSGTDGTGQGLMLGGILDG